MIIDGEIQSRTNMYGTLRDELDNAFNQASAGKGKERHSNDKPFTDQPIFWIEEHFKSFQLGQAVKKIHESQKLPKEQAIKELHGAIVYLAAKIINLREVKEIPEEDPLMYREIKRRQKG